SEWQCETDILIAQGRFESTWHRQHSTTDIPVGSPLAMCRQSFGDRLPIYRNRLPQYDTWLCRHGRRP
ncbi:MAG: hypothetical protein ACFNLC_04905, partial [Prevotella denticola]